MQTASLRKNKDILNTEQVYIFHGQLNINILLITVVDITIYTHMLLISNGIITQVFSHS